MNPLLKTFLTALAGVAAPTLLSAIDHPTGGLASALSTNPTYAIVWGAASLLAHNLLESYVPSANPPSAPSSTNTTSK